MLTNEIKPTPEDKRWLEEMTRAIEKQDEPTIVRLLEKGGPRRSAMLWAKRAALAPFAPTPEQTMSALQTRRDEAWDVRWMFTSDRDVKVIDGLFSSLPAELKVLLPLKPILTHVRKQFGPPRDGVVQGGTTFGYTPGLAGGGIFTTNVIRPAMVDGVLAPVMTYKEELTPFKPFQDCFFALTPNIMLAVGRTGVRKNENEITGLPTNPFYRVRGGLDSGKASLESS